MIAVICDGCGDIHRQVGPNTGSVPTPNGWRQVSLEANMQPTIVQHQCASCFAAIERALREQRSARSGMPTLSPGSLPPGLKGR